MVSKEEIWKKHAEKANLPLRLIREIFQEEQLGINYKAIKTDRSEKMTREHCQNEIRILIEEEVKHRKYTAKK